MLPHTKEQDETMKVNSGQEKEMVVVKELFTL